MSEENVYITPDELKEIASELKATDPTKAAKLEKIAAGLSWDDTIIFDGYATAIKHG